MVFVTVGTHEQQFNRLVEYMDNWAANHEEDVIIQIGYSTYKPHKAKWARLFPYPKMVEMVDQARVVVTHGGPSSFILPLQKGKTPIVVPRRFEFDEHVNDHQGRFCKEVESRMGTIVVIEDINMLGRAIENYDKVKKEKKNISNNAKFCEGIGNIVEEMFKEMK